MLYNLEYINPSVLIVVDKMHSMSLFKSMVSLMVKHIQYKSDCKGLGKINIKSLNLRFILCNNKVFVYLLLRKVQGQQPQNNISSSFLILHTHTKYYIKGLGRR